MEKYKLVREYPGSPQLDTIITDSNGWRTTWENANKYPEFWEKVIEKDYEILSFTNNEKLIWNKAKDGRFDAKWQMYRPTEEDSLKEPGITIHSVKRLSDGEIFTIGDELKNNERIVSISIIDNKIRIYPQHSFYYLKDIQKVKTKLFKTEDGVDISNENVEFFAVKKENFIVEGPYTVKNLHEEARIWDGSDGYLQFSTKEKAEEYILMNKPCLSLNDILKILPKYISLSKARYEDLKKLVQQK